MMAEDGVVLPMPISPVPTRPIPSALALVGQLDADLHGGQGLVTGHGRSLGKVAGAAGDLCVDQSRGIAEVIIDPHIHHPHLGPDMAGQHVDPGAAGQEVEDHLRGDFLGEEGNPFFDDAVIAGKGEDDFLGDIRLGIAADGGHAAGEFLQPPQGAERLGLVVQLGLGLAQQFRVDRFDAFNGLRYPCVFSYKSF